MRLIENYVARAEQLLNPVDWIPFVSSYSGMMRMIAGAIEIVAGAVFVYMKIVNNLLNGTRARCGKALQEGYIYSLHGAANMIRAALAIVPGLNLLLFIHDQKLGRFNYPQEELRPGVYPLATAKNIAESY
jgi:hypothetical protein